MDPSLKFQPFFGAYRLMLPWRRERKQIYLATFFFYFQAIFYWFFKRYLSISTQKLIKFGSWKKTGQQICRNNTHLHNECVTGTKLFHKMTQFFVLRVDIIIIFYSMKNIRFLKMDDERIFSQQTFTLCSWSETLTYHYFWKFFFLIYVVNVLG